MSNRPRKHVSTLLPDIPWNILRGSKLSLGKSVLPDRLPVILRVSPCSLRLGSGKYLHAGMLPVIADFPSDHFFCSLSWLEPRLLVAHAVLLKPRATAAWVQMDAMAAELVSSPLRHCPLCTAGSALQPQGDTPAVWGLSYATGFVRLRAQRLRCPSCRAWFLGCWAYPHGGQSRVVIACHPTACSWFFFRERLHADSFVALHTEYLRFMSTAFLFLRASFSGLVKTVQAMFPGPDLTHHDCQRCVEHGWFLYNTLQHTWAASRVGTVFDVRLDALDRTLAQHEPWLHDLLHRHASSHTCVHCSNPVLAGDGGMKLTTSLCNERTSASFTDSQLGLRVTLGCTKRPQAKSVFCRGHQLPPSPQLPPEIRDHKRISGHIHFRYVGSADFLPLQQVAAARLRQYDSKLALLDYATADPGRFGGSERDGAPAEAISFSLLILRFFPPLTRSYSFSLLTKASQPSLPWPGAWALFFCPAPSTGAASDGRY